jgi:molybdate transport system regulatory protein
MQSNSSVRSAASPGAVEATTLSIVRCSVQISARNQLAGVIASIEDGAVMSIVVIRLPGGEEVASSITKGSVHRLHLEVGQPATAIIKSTDVIIAVE